MDGWTNSRQRRSEPAQSSGDVYFSKCSFSTTTVAATVVPFHGPATTLLRAACWSHRVVAAAAAVVVVVVVVAPTIAFARENDIISVLARQKEKDR